MKNILNSFLITVLLASPVAQVIAQEQTLEAVVVAENKQPNQDPLNKKVLSFVKENQNAIKSAGLLGYSAYIAFKLVQDLGYEYAKISNKEYRGWYKALELMIIEFGFVISGLMSAGYALELSPEIIKNSPEILQKIENKIKTTKSDIFNWMKNNKKKSLTAIAFFSMKNTFDVLVFSVLKATRDKRLLAGTKMSSEQMEKFMDNIPNLEILMAASSAILSAGLAYDVAKNK